MKKTNKPSNPLKFFNDNRAMAYKKAGGAMKDFKKSLPKAQTGKVVKPTADSTEYFKKDIKAYDQLIKNSPNTPMGITDKYLWMDVRSRTYDKLKRQSLKGKPGYDKNGFPIKSATPTKTSVAKVATKGIMSGINAAKKAVKNSKK